MPKARVRFHPQAWFQDHALDIEPEGETTFEVDARHLEAYSENARKYELEPYLNLPQLPAWILDWRGPFWFAVEVEPAAASAGAAA